jgi:hypothetical protein
MLEKRSQDQLILEAARFREDDELKEQVFEAFKLEASTWPALEQRQPGLQQRFSINKHMEESGSPADPIPEIVQDQAAEEHEVVQDDTEPPSSQAVGHSESHHRARCQQPRAGIKLSRSKSAPHTPKQTPVEHDPVREVESHAIFSEYPLRFGDLHADGNSFRRITLSKRHRPRTRVMNMTKSSLPVHLEV